MKERKLTKRGSKRREQILQVAGGLFADQGYHRTTVGDVCETLGVGKGVFYWYFESKEALFSELLESALFNLRKSQQAAIENVTHPVERIEKGIRASIDFFRTQSEVLSLIRIAGREEQFQGLVHKGHQVVVSDTETHIKEGQAGGHIRGGDPELMAHGILGAIFHFVEVYFEMQDTADYRPGLEDEAVRFCLQGLLNRRA